MRYAVSCNVWHQEPRATRAVKKGCQEIMCSSLHQLEFLKFVSPILVAQRYVVVSRELLQGKDAHDRVVAALLAIR